MSKDTKAEQQLKLQIEHAINTMPEGKLVEHIIKLYGDEFTKANARIDELTKANDELFRIKQKVVIANRELMRRNGELEKRFSKVPAVTDKVRDALKITGLFKRFNDDEDDTTAHAVSILRKFIKDYDKAQLLDVEAHKIKAEDTPA